MTTINSFAAPLVAMLVTFGAAEAASATNDRTTSVVAGLTVTRNGSGAGVVSANVGGIDCGLACTATLAPGTQVTLSAAPLPGSQFTGWLGPCTGAGTCEFQIDTATTVAATFAPNVIGAPRLDIDGTAGCDALTDGLLAIRYLFGLSGEALTRGAIGVGATRTSSAQVAGYLGDVHPVLDIDGIGQVDPETDGLLLTRYLFGWRAESLVAGALGSGASRSASAIESRIQGLCLPSASLYTLSVGTIGTGSGTVSSSPGLISCGSACYANFAGGALVEVSAAPGANSTFAGWSGDCSGTGPCGVMMDAAKSVSASFAANGCASCFGPGVSVSAIDEFGHGAATLSAPGGYLPPGGGGADVDGRVPAPVDTQPSGSSIYYAVARPAAANHAITDNKVGNTYTELDTGNYGLGSGAPWVNATGYRIGINGGPNHILTTPSVLFNEATLAWDQIRQGHVLASHGHVFRPSGATQSSPLGIGVTGPAWVYVDWFGDGNTFGPEGFQWTVTAIDEGPAIGAQWQVVDSRIVNHNNGWIQWKRWRRYFPSAASNIQLALASLNPVQGADFHVAAFQETQAGAIAESRAVPKVEPISGDDELLGRYEARK